MIDRDADGGQGTSGVAGQVDFLKPHRLHKPLDMPDHCLHRVVGVILWIVGIALTEFVDRIDMEVLG